jgi:ParB family chromosome partitioning protein
LRVNKLIQPLKVRLDDECFGIVAAVALSYLKEKEQRMVEKILATAKINKIGIGQAKKLRKESESAELVLATIHKILKNEKPPVAVKPFKVKTEIVSEYFVNGESEYEIESVISEALRAYFSK